MSSNKIEISIKDIPETTEALQEAEKEIERLNNIINELEKDMIFDMNDYGKDLDIQTGNIYIEYHRGYCQNGKDYYDKLQELKHKKIYGSVDSEIIYFDELGSVSNE